jgi:outer membrane protein OmpA-like peptidoglycan-associated protein
METLPPPLKEHLFAEGIEPRRRSVLPLLAGLLLFAIAGVVVWYLWDRVSRLEHELAAAEQRKDSLDRQIDKNRSDADRLRKQSESAQEAAGAAQRDAEREAAARQQAEIEREAAREKAEQATTEAVLSRQEVEELRKAREQELDRMQEALSRIAETSRTPLGMVVSLGEDRFLFDFDKADLKPENRELLSRISGVLLASHGYRLYVYGHTDDIGTEEYNQQLSERRAKSVRDYLVKAGIPDEIVASKGFGKKSPRVTAKTRDARQKNRRVEIGVVDTIINYEKVVSENSQPK